MTGRFKRLFIAGLCICFCAASEGYSQRREYSQIVTVNDYTYEIDVDGTRDPVNETIVIENLGDKTLVNPRITVGGRFDWFDVPAVAAEATRGCVTDEEKALAVWKFIVSNFHHLAPPGDRETHNPVVGLNVYGYANCAYHSSIFVSLCRAAGVKARIWEVWHHTVSEAYYNNAWHMLDSDIGLYYLMDDNRTIASMEQLWADQKATGGKEKNVDLTKFSGRNRAVFLEYTDVEGNDAYVSQDGVRVRGYRYFHDDDHCYVQTGYDRFCYIPHSMALRLRPNETLVRNWKGGEKFYDHKRHQANYKRDKFRWNNPILYGDGQLIWKPDLNSEQVRLAVAANSPPPAYYIDDNQKPALHVRHRQGGVFDVPTRVILNIKTPYTILGGRLKAEVYRGASSEWDRITASIISPTGPVKKEVWSAPEGAVGEIELDVDLDEILYPTGERGKHKYSVVFHFSTDEKNDPPTQSGVESVEIVTDIQCAPNSLPALSLGRNVIRYRDETPGPHKVRITHSWRERSDNHPPQAPRVAIYPKDGVTVADLAPNFRWRKTTDLDRGDKVADHWITISFDPQCRWPIATALSKVTGSGKFQWQISPGWLNPDTTYYWRVKAKDSRGLWGDWGPVFSFRTAAG